MKLRTALIVGLVFVWSVAQTEAPAQPSLWERFSAKIGSDSATELMIRLWVGLRSTVGLPVTAESSEATAKYINVARGKPYSFSAPPNYPYCTDPDDAIQLTDGRYTNGYFWTQKSTVGWQGRRPVVVTIDLGEVEPIRGMSYNTAAGVAGVEWPIAVYMLVSDDGMIFHALGDLVTMSDAREPPPAKGYAVHRYWVDTLKTHGRFVQLILDSGGGCCFVDEIEVYRGEDAWTISPLDGEATIGGTAYFNKAFLNTAFKRRLNNDLRDTHKLLDAAKLAPEVLQPFEQELADIKNAIDHLPRVDPATFRAVFPLNDIHTRIFAVQGMLRRVSGRSPLQAWVCHPLDYITPSQAPLDDRPAKLSVAMMRGEWRSTVLNLTSSTDKSITVELRIQGLPGGENPGWIRVHRVEWTDTKELKPIGVALPEVAQESNYFPITIPAGMTRQIWFTLHPVGVPAGTYSGQVTVTWPGGEPITVPLALRIFPMDFPQKPTLHVGGWDYTDQQRRTYDVTSMNRAALIAHLSERFVDSPWGTSSVLTFGPQDAYDNEGNLLKPLDTSTFDSWVAHWPNARQYCVSLGVGDSFLGTGAVIPQFNNIVKSWISYWVKHAQSRGIKPEQIVLLPLDEPHENKQDEIIVAWAKAVKAAQPKVVLWEDPTYENPWDALPEMMSSVDVLCPNRTQLLQGGKEFEDFYRKQKAAGRRLAFYSCSGPMHLLDPYSYVRLQAWTCWDMGAESSFFWAFGDAGGGNPWRVYDSPGSNYAPMFLAPDSVTAGKHMEAIRESVEDYEYFVMLRDAVAKAKAENPAVAKAKDLLATGARRVLKAPNADKMNWSDPKDRWAAETVRLEILETLTALGK